MHVSLLTALWVLWGAITAVLAGFIIYRSLIGLKEEDQLFLSAAETHLQAQQQEVVLKVERLGNYVKALSIASAAILLVIAGIWIYRGVTGVASPGLE